MPAVIASLTTWFSHQPERAPKLIGVMPAALSLSAAALSSSIVVGGVMPFASNTAVL